MTVSPEPPKLHRWRLHYWQTSVREIIIDAYDAEEAICLANEDLFTPSDTSELVCKRIQEVKAYWAKRQSEPHGSRGCCFGCRWCFCCGRRSGRSLVGCSRNRHGPHGAGQAPGTAATSVPSLPEDGLDRCDPLPAPWRNSRSVAIYNTRLSPSKNSTRLRRPQERSRP